MKEALKYYIIKMCRCILSLGRIIPAKNNVILMNSFNGDQYSDSPKYLCEYMRKERPGKYQYVWAVKQPEKYRELEAEDLVFIQMNSLKFYWYALTAKIFIINDGLPSIIPKTGKSRMIINTWHGFGYKKQGQSRLNKKHYELKYKKLRYDAVSVWLTPAQFFTDRSLKNRQGEIINSGLPRNDILFQETYELRTKVREMLGVGNKKIILYAPTYRPGNTLPEMSVDFQKILRAVSIKFPEDEWTFVLRLHRLLIPNYADIIKSYGYIDASAYEDMQELMIASDILISDYSSVIWDFSLMSKPVFLYAEDYQTYRIDPGLHMDYDELPFLFAENINVLCQKIQEFNLTEYIEDLKKYHLNMGCVDLGHACARVLKRIEEF